MAFEHRHLVCNTGHYLLEVNISGPDSRFVWKLPLRQESCHLLCRRSQAAADGSDHLPRDQIEHWSEPADDGGNALQSILTIEVITMSSRPMEENRPHVYLKHQTQRCLAVLPNCISTGNLGGKVVGSDEICFIFNWHCWQWSCAQSAHEIWNCQLLTHSGVFSALLHPLQQHMGGGLPACEPPFW